MGKILSAFFRQQFGSIVRALLAFLGGWLVANGLIDQAGADSLLDALMTIAINGVPLVIAAIWSWVRNRKIAERVEG